MHNDKALGERRIQLMGPGVILGDLYRLSFFVMLYSVLFCIYWLVGGPVGIAAIAEGVAGTANSLWLGMPSRMRLLGHKERAIAENYLESKAYRRDGDVWTPALPRLLYFDCQKVSVRGTEVLGPVVTLRKLQRLFEAV